jgi:hypothetical protein
MMKYKGCRHLDYSEKYASGGQCTLINPYGMVYYWYRNIVPYDEAPRKVQFCGKGMGRINNPFSCVNPEQPCFEEQEQTEKEKS